jgi:hypothetical protein
MTDRIAAVLRVTALEWKLSAPDVGASFLEVEYERRYSFAR